MKDKSVPTWWRVCVGGMWEEIGTHQFEIMKEIGLKPHHLFMDVGCGAFRGGIHYMTYLNPGNYLGLDADEEVIQAGFDHELKEEHFLREPRVCVDPHFTFSKMLKEGELLDYAIAQSVFTHLPKKMLEMCLENIYPWMREGAHFVITIFESKNDVAWPTAEPFYHSVNMIRSVTKDKWSVIPSRWRHERRQTWLVLTKKGLCHTQEGDKHG